MFPDFFRAAHSAIAGRTKEYCNVHYAKEILESFFFCMYLGSFTAYLSTKLNEDS